MSAIPDEHSSFMVVHVILIESTLQQTQEGDCSSCVPVSSGERSTTNEHKAERLCIWSDVMLL